MSEAVKLIDVTERTPGAAQQLWTEVRDLLLGHEAKLPLDLPALVMVMMHQEDGRTQPPMAVFIIDPSYPALSLPPGQAPTFASDRLSADLQREAFDPAGFQPCLEALLNLIDRRCGPGGDLHPDPTSKRTRIDLMIAPPSAHERARMRRLAP